ncbi:survival protein SurE-like phosphatase/nucleotidase [Actinidia rufa]|uniref:Survival protein SurE-like phosphatase/nucleotidase n=1 Tax=Actinidia rufa TaxID=165716 RepID=A0A7J0GBE6_9ERIC|nr:survival protein SurE-like phosphatase/nucleotidase [Actinidia rufa]
MTTSAVKNNLLPPGLVSNLQQVLLSRKGGEDEQSKKNGDDSDEKSSSTSPSDEIESNSDKDDLRPIVLVTNGDGIESPGLTYLVEALGREDLYNVHVCAPQSDKSVSGHSVTLGETVAVSSAEIHGATAFEVSGTPVDCVSLALSGALFSWSNPLLVISGINKGSCCGHHMIYSGVVAGAREALISGVPSMSISLNWKKDESQDSDFKDAATVCLPLITAAIRDIKKGIFPKSCLLNVEVPTSALTNKGFKLTKQSLWRSTPSWQAIPANKSAGRFMSNQQSLGMQLAQLSRDASAAGAARRLTTQRKNFGDKEQDDMDEDIDFRAVQDGFVAITPLSLSPHIELDIQTAASEWISAALHTEQ